MSVIDWFGGIGTVVSAVAAVVAAVFAGLSWWGARKSAESAERSAQGVENLARSLDAPLFDVDWLSSSVFVLTNRTGSETVIDRVVNRESFVQLDLSDGTVCAPFESVQVQTLDVWGAQLPATLVLSCGGSLVHIPLRLGDRRRIKELSDLKSEIKNLAKVVGKKKS